MTLSANRRYILQITVFEVYNPDAILYCLKINNEPIIRVNSEIGTGDHFYPFFTGIKIENVKITGGANALISDFPWQIFLISGNEQCGGSIISGKWVITAAHCTKDSNNNPIPASK